MGKLRSPKVEASGSGSSASAAPVNADYLVGTANATLTNEIVVGTTPGGELGGTWASPTIDTIHSGSSHASAAAAETADIRSVDVLVGTATTAFSGEIVVGTMPGGELGGTWASPTVDATHSGSAHHTRLHDLNNSSDHNRTDINVLDVYGGTSFAIVNSLGASGGFIRFMTDEGAGLNERLRAKDTGISVTGTAVISGQATQNAGKNILDTDHTGAADPHTGYVLESLLDAKGDIIAASADNTPAKVTAGANGTMLTAQSGQSAGVLWASVFTQTTFTKTGVLTTGTGATRWYNDTGRTLTFSKIRASVGTAPATQSILCDVNVDGTTIWSTQGNRVAVAAAANTGTQTSFDTTTIADGHYLTVDIDQVGTGTAGSDLTVQIWMTG